MTPLAKEFSFAIHYGQGGSIVVASPRSNPSIMLLAIMLAAVMFIMGSDLNIVSPFLVDMSHSFHVGVSLTGWLVTAFACGYALASPLAGNLSDRIGRFPTLVLGMAGFIVFETVSGLAPTLWLEAASRLLAGVTAGAVSPIAYALVGDEVPKDRRAGVMSILSMGFSVSTVAGVPLGLWLATAIGWRGTLLGIGAALLLAGAGLTWVLRQHTPKERDPGAPSRTDYTIWGLLGGTWPQLLASMTAFGAMGLVYTYYPTALIHHGLPRVWLIFALAFYGLFNLFGNWTFGRMGDRKGAARTVRMAQLLELGALALLAASAVWAPLLGIIGAASLFAATQAYIPDLKALAADVPARLRGTSLAFNNTAMYGGMMVGSAIANTIYHSGAFGWLAIGGMISIAIGFISMLGGRYWIHQRVREA